MIVCATGHRPQDLNGFTDDARRLLIDVAIESLEIINPETVISGMALGWDQAVAEAAIELNISFIAAIPFKGQEEAWPKFSKEKYRNIVRKASDVIIVSEGGYESWKMQVRNKWMVDHSEEVLALWNDQKLSGGTFNCINYAVSKNKTVKNAWEIYQKFLDNSSITTAELKLVDPSHIARKSV